MNRELRRVSLLVVAMFLALFGSATIIQVFQQGNLKADARNTRVLYASFDTERGQILVAGDPIASSTPVDSRYNYQRVYADGPLYAPVTGFFTVLPSAGNGIEAELNTELAGNSNVQFLDRLTSILTGQDPEGASVALTLDPVVQQAAWDALGSETGAVVAIDPRTGRILAMVSKPTYDPNDLAALNGQQVLDAYNGLDADPREPLVNRAIAGDLNPPGSTFKLVVAAAALESGEYTPESTFPNPAELELPGTSTLIRNSTDGTCGSGATASIATALRLSCNTTFAQLAGALGDDAIREQAEKFGFGQSFSIPMASASSQYPETADQAETWLSGFGQASVRATPLQMALVSAAIANGGIVPQPTLVDSIVAPDLTVLQSFQPGEFGRAISPDTATTLSRLMVDSVATGVASNARIDGVEVGGKTGTAENGPGEPYSLWFTGFAPANDPQVAIAVVIEDRPTGYGNLIAAPIAKKVMEAVLSR